MDKINTLIKFVLSLLNNSLLIAGAIGVIFGIAPEEIRLKLLPLFSDDIFAFYAKALGITSIIIFFYLRTKNKNSKKEESYYCREQSSIVALFNFLDQYPFNGTIGDRYMHYFCKSYECGYMSLGNKIDDHLKDVFQLIEKIVTNDNLKLNLHYILNLFKRRGFSKQEKQELISEHQILNHKSEIVFTRFKNEEEYLSERKQIKKTILYIKNQLNKNKVK